MNNMHYNASQSHPYPFYYFDYSNYPNQNYHPPHIDLAKIQSQIKEEYFDHGNYESVKKQEEFQSASLEKNSTKKIDTIQANEVKVQQDQKQAFFEVREPEIKDNKKKKSSKKKENKTEDNDEYQPEIVEEKQENPINLYLKKNTQSNLINQIFSFVSSPNKCMSYLMKYFNNQRPKCVFYFELFKAIKRGRKKYINRKFLINLCSMDENHPSYKMFKRGKGVYSKLSLEEFRLALRTLIWIFLDVECIICITTSKKLKNQTWPEHLSRRRQVKNFLRQALKEELRE